jgi:hypothetical protein
MLPNTGNTGALLGVVRPRDRTIRNAIHGVRDRNPIRLTELFEMGSPLSKALNFVLGENLIGKKSFGKAYRRHFPVLFPGRDSPSPQRRQFGLRNDGTDESFYGDRGASSGCFVAWWEVKRRTVMVVE